MSTTQPVKEIFRCRYCLEVVPSDSRHVWLHQYTPVIHAFYYEKSPCYAAYWSRAYVYSATM